MPHRLPVVVGLAALLLTACGGKPPAQVAAGAPEQAPPAAAGRGLVRVGGSDTVRMVNGDQQSAGKTERSAREQSSLNDRYAQAQAAAARIDSVLVSPAILEMRVGDSISAIGKTLTLKAVDSAGVEVPGFLPGMRLRYNSVLKVRRQNVVAVRPGEATLHIEVVGQNPRRTSTEVTIVVK